MSIFKSTLICLSLAFSASLFAQEASEETTQGFISDDLQVFMHSGAGNNYRILGTVNAGVEVQLTNKTQNDYTQIIDPKGRVAWVESIHVSTNPGLRNVIAEMNGKLADLSDQNSQLEQQLTQLTNDSSQLSSEKAQLNNEIASLTQQLTATQAKLKDQDTNIKKEWFFNGAIVLGVGLLLGLILPRLGSRRKSNIDSWN